MEKARKCALLRNKCTKIKRTGCKRENEE